MVFSFDPELLKSLLDKKLSRYMTSAEVVIEASGLRIEAIRSIAREQGIEIENVRSRCIDENLLSYFADAHIRRLKSYFNNSKRHIGELTCSEHAAFDDFCLTFKKSIHKPVSWEDIDTDVIREHFFEKVYSLCPKTQVSDMDVRESHFIGNCLIIETVQEFDQKLPYNHPLFNTYHRRSLMQWQEKFHCIENVLVRVYESRYYYSKPLKEKIVYNDKRIFIRSFFLSARYYLFPDDDDYIVA